MQIFRTPTLNDLMLFITYLGNWRIVFLGAFFICLILLLRKRWYHLSTFVISVGGGEVLVWIIKHLVERPRPPLVNALTPETSFSFPSGHGFVALSFYGLLSYYLFHISKNKFQKLLSILFGITIVLLIGISRIYLGVHWPTDVLASFAVGSAWLTTLITLIEIKKKYNPHKIKIPFLKKKYILSLSIFLTILWFSFIIFYFKTHPLKTIDKQKLTPIELTKSDIPNKLFPTESSKFSETITGKYMEPINIIVIGNEKKLFNIFKEINWYPCDPVTIKNNWRLANAIILNKPYPEAPGIPSFWNTKPNEISFEQPTDLNSAKERHHIHFWETSFLIDNQPVWFGTVHFDKNAILKNKIIPTHIIDPAVDKERNRIKEILLKNKNVNSMEEFQIVEPTLGSNQAGSLFFTDGKTLIIFLKNN